MDEIAKRAATVTVEFTILSLGIGVFVTVHPIFGLLWFGAVFYFTYSILSEATELIEQKTEPDPEQTQPQP